jgi:hypothetical protein
MYYNHVQMQDYVRHHVDELLREAENDRLAYHAVGPGRPVRRRIADWLVAVAEWVDEQPQGSFARVEA